MSRIYSLHLEKNIEQMGNGRQEQRGEKPGIGRRHDGERERERERSSLRRREGEEWRAATGESERALGMGLGVTALGLGWESRRLGEKNEEALE
jgi:hypothetical protein